MASFINSPYPVFFDTDGTPLENGFIYIGTANQNPVTSPINVYWDEALTQPAAQPIRTLNGYAARNGTPSQLYTDSTNFSMLVRNRKESQVYYIQDATVSISSSQISFLQYGTGAVSRTAQEKMRDTVSAKDFGAVGDGVTDDTAAFQALEATYEGEYVNLNGMTYSVTSEPSKAVYYNGSFKVGSSYIYKDTLPWPTPFGKASIKVAAGHNDGHYGFNNGIAEVGTGATSKWVMVYRKASGHELTNGAQIWASDSYDNGQTWTNERIIYRTASYDTRNFVVSRMGSNRIGVIASQRDVALVYTNALFLYSDDAGVTWSSASITSPTPGMIVNFHGAMLSYPASVGGNDTNGFIAFSYGPGGNIDAYYTTDNGANWTIQMAVAKPDATGPSGPGLTYDLSEMATARLGSENKWLMVVRNAATTTSGAPSASDSNAVAYISTNLLTWTGPVDTGLLLKGNPPQLIYDSGRFWFFAFSRRNRQLLDKQSSHLLVASASATALFNNGGSFSALKKGWQVATSIPDWASGYFHPFKFSNKWFGAFVCQEQLYGGSNGAKTNSVCLLGDFTAETVGATQVFSLVPQRNEILNPAFQVWQNGTSFSATSTTGVETANNWTIACPSGQTINAVQGALPVGDKQLDGDPRYYIRLTGISSAGKTHYLATKIYGVQQLRDTRLTLSFWALSSSGVDPARKIQAVNIIQNFGTGGSPSSPVAHEPMVDVQTSGTWRKFNVSFHLLSSLDKTLGTNGDDYIWVLFYMPESSTYDISIANVKLERGSNVTPFVVETEQQVISALGNTTSSTKAVSSGAITVPASNNVLYQVVGASGSVDLNTINGGKEGQIVMFATASSSYTITFKDSTVSPANLSLSADFAMNNPADMITLIKRGSIWYEVSRSNNA